MKQIPVTPTFLGWVAAVLKHGFATWHSHEGWLAVLSYAAILVLAVTNFGIIELGSDVQKVISGAATILLISNVLIISPYILWREATNNCNTLIDITDYEKALDTLSEYLEDGNQNLFNGRVRTADDDFEPRTDLNQPVGGLPV